MAHIIELRTHADSRGALTVLEKVLPFSIVRTYWMTNLSGEARGQHRHKETWQALVCLQGKCDVVIKKHQQKTLFSLEKPNQVLLLEPEDWHEMNNFQDNPILMVMASHHYDPNDYIKEPLA